MDISSVLKVIAIIFIIVAGLGYVVDVDYYLMMPGTAEHLRPIIEVDGELSDEKGKFMLTTVSSIPGNMLFYTFANISNRIGLYEIEIKEKEEVLGHFDMDDDLYRQIMLLYMSQSQQEAVYNAFLLANEDVEFIENAVLVRDVAPDSMAVNILRPGDSIKMVDGFEVKNSEQMIEYVRNQRPGDTVHIVYERGGESREADIMLMTHPEVDEARIGIMIMTDRELVTNRDVRISTGRIGGSSAGMMFTLEIYNQLVEQDITKGYYIAGTGTINADGYVGQIGGVKHKVRAARRANADIFFVPMDIHPYDTNEQEANTVNARLDEPITVVPIKHIQDAIDYLEGLPAR
ncbi:hypothetical protein BHF68_02490 [Desulfuribacillus alkaliarsenatis]|uniref:endopeptidase La n=1 Tax=Desulfuribacillus alkaliarsenatis TaxID=766136 RepID=A0A1E5G6I6_9FIRM|nr:hypothetical protein BHF68_02490 [Desulfuribacillus alkaliarsenatis]